MAYTPTTWNTGDTINATKLNNIEQGIVAITDKTQSFLLHAGKSVNITFSKYQCAALIFCAVSNTAPLVLIYTNGYLAPAATTSDFTTSISSNYKTITITNNTSIKQCYVAVQEFGDATFEIEEVSS